jgi:hypothetical protein
MHLKLEKLVSSSSGFFVEASIEDFQEEYAYF